MKANVDKTRAYYCGIADSDLCDCGYCRSYRAQIRTALPEIAAYLDSLGIDIGKPFETSPLEPDESGMLVYCGCQYIVFGSCEAKYRHRIGDVEFRVAVSHPQTGIGEEHFVLEFFPVKLKYME